MSTRRAFIRKSTLAALSASLGMDIVYGKYLPENLLPLFLEQQDFYTKYEKNEDMVILNDRPWNAEATAHLLDDEITPASKMFVRNNGLVPTDIDVKNWSLTVDGESVSSSKTYSLADLKKFPSYTYRLTLECGGNGRSEFDPQPKAINGLLEPSLVQSGLVYD